jgi:hypothetical protein
VFEDQFLKTRCAWRSVSKNSDDPNMTYIRDKKFQSNGCRQPGADPRPRSHGPRPRASAQSAEELQYIVMNRRACFGSGLTRFLPYVPIKGCVGIYLPKPRKTFHPRIDLLLVAIVGLLVRTPSPRRERSCGG